MTLAYSDYGAEFTYFDNQPAQLNEIRRSRWISLYLGMRQSARKKLHFLTAQPHRHSAKGNRHATSQEYGLRVRFPAEKRKKGRIAADPPLVIA